MEWKYVKVNNEETTFRTYKDGRFMNEATGRFYKGTIRNGYKWYDFRWNKKKYSKSQHRLIGEYFLSNPDNLPVIHHIDGNKLNNSIENLKWTSYSENNLGVNRRSTDVDHRDTQNYDLTLEEWKPFRNTVYMISNLGRLKNAQTDKVHRGKITSSGYREYCLRINKKKTSLSAHRIVWEVWGDSEPKIINHINGNKLDNRIINLESITSSENNFKSIYETKTHKFKRTAAYDDEGNTVCIYMNNADAARAMGVRPQSIHYAIQNNIRSCGYYWKNLEN